MSDFPLLPLPVPEVRKPPRGRPFQPSRPHGPTRQRQGQRLGPVFERLATVLDGDGDPLVLGDDPGGLAPERVIVFEVAGSISGFASACSKVPGMAYLAEQESELEPDEDFWTVDARKGRKGQRREDKLVDGRVYAAMPDVRALRELLSLWRRYQRGADADYGFGPWFDLFDYLYELRPWGPKDRVSDDTLEGFRQDLDAEPDGPVTIEVELWHRENRAQRARARGKLASVVEQARGSLVHQASIPPIGYEAALVRLPRGEIVRILDREPVHLVVCDDIMFVRPQCSPRPQPASEPLAAGASPGGAAPDPAQPPIAALLDGVPVQRHQLLDGRVVVDDPDALEDRSPVAGRRHGTAMASLILHGDRGQPEPPLSRLLHIHPVMHAPEDGRPEGFRPDRLLVDTIHRAVLRMRQGDDGAEPTAPDVFVVNLSLGDTRRPYAGWISPWARLLDYLAHRYGVLFVVSAGNIPDPLPIPRFPTVTELEDAPSSSREEAVLDGLGRQRSKRTLLSPSEALNVVTVGAAHEEAAASGGGPSGTGAFLDPYGSATLPNVSSAMGLGHRKAIKPEILMPGGREHAVARPGANECSVRPGPAGRIFGVRAASPDEQGRLDREANHSGTSVAAALATRAAHRLFDGLMDPLNGGLLANADPAYYAVVVRALLVHGASWCEATASKLEDLYGPHGQGKHVARLDNVARLIGYGIPRIADAMTCRPERATLVGYGRIESGQMAVCRLPLPPSLRNVTMPRSITVTLAWFSPVNVRNLAYRVAKLEVNGKFETEFGTPRVKHQPSHSSIPRGTLFHQRYHGDQAVPFVANGELTFSITCKESAGALDAPIRYGLAVTIEAGEGVPVYQEIRDRLVVRTMV